ncbi:MAG: sigma-70 family RNA polymerase sigma factor [Oscillospiraceae bacterium]|nr:sigma-70 family RNA polymerase sigma factor [Oscillospiraceae bacterium]MBQ6404282.1 sigma-70 family RNA polymerase sigma factor [Oscillospiraceae bacterium]
MEDSQIVQLYWNRDAAAIPASSEAYGTYCHSIAFRILSDEQDAEEAVNDTWLHAWNAIPPHRPAVLSTFLGKLTRRISITMLQHRRAQKRGGGAFDLVLEELSECVSGGETAEQAAESRALGEAINAFLASLPRKKRSAFLLRYWHAEPVSAIAQRLGMTESNVSVTLHRTRAALRDYLTERGFDV